MLGVFGIALLNRLACLRFLSGSLGFSGFLVYQRHYQAFAFLHHIHVEVFADVGLELVV
jgi:hypothetical protein